MPIAYTGKLVTFKADEGIGFIRPFHVSGLHGLTYCKIKMHISHLTSECPEEMIEGSTLVFDIDDETKNAVRVAVVNFGGFRGMGRAEAARRIRARAANVEAAAMPEAWAPENPLMIEDEGDPFDVLFGPDN